MTHRFGKLLLAVSISLELAGCATNPIPAGYSGPIATIRDSTQSESSNRAQFYFLSEIDGRTVENALTVTRGTNYGKGFSLTPVDYSREIPAQTAVFTLNGKIGYGAPIEELFNSKTVYSVTKKFTFTPESNKAYIVRGQLTADKQEVWLEDESGSRVELSTAPKK